MRNREAGENQSRLSELARDEDAAHGHGGTSQELVPHLGDRHEVDRISILAFSQEGVVPEEDHSIDLFDDGTGGPAATPSQSRPAQPALLYVTMMAPAVPPRLPANPGRHSRPYYRPTISSGRTQASNCSAVSSPDSRADSRS